MVNSTSQDHLIAQCIDANREAQIAWLQELASFPSTRGDEAECQTWLSHEFKKRRYDVDEFTIADVDIDGLSGSSPRDACLYSKAKQVVATHQPSCSRGRSLILQGHVDVVPPGPLNSWSIPPFTPKIDGSRMYGRGVNDMKTGVTQMVFALDAIRAAGFEPAGRIHLQTVTEEECTGNGALATLARGYRADACLIPESLNNKLVRAQLGSIWFRLRINGKAAHVMDPTSAISAILASQHFIKAYQLLENRYNSIAHNNEYYSNTPKPIGFSVGKIQGGDWVGSVPAWCTLDCRLSVPPGVSLKKARRDIYRAAAKVDDAQEIPPTAIEWIGFHAEPYVLQPGSDAEAALSEAHASVFDSPLETFALTATTDARQYGLYYDIPSLCYGGCGGGSHAVNEWTDLDSMLQTTKVIARFVALWCRLTKHA